MAGGHTALAFYLWMFYLWFLRTITHFSSLQHTSSHSPLASWENIATTDLYAVPSVWYSLPPDISMSCTLISFKSPCSNVILIKEALPTIR